MAERRSGRRRAAPSDGERTTLRVPSDLQEVVDRLAAELGTSGNDALLRLARRGADLYRQELEIAERREQRWQAVLDSRADVDEVGEPLSPDEIYDAIMRARTELPPE